MTSLDRSSLATYLNDHLAGSIAALELMNRICTTHVDNDLGELMARFRQEVEEEQALLRSLVEATGESESRLGKSIAWLGEKISRLKIGPGSDGDSGLMLFEALEALSMGFWGRRSLWRALDHLGFGKTLTPEVDFAALAERAQHHLDVLEPLRLHASLAALTESAPS